MAHHDETEAELQGAQDQDHSAAPRQCLSSCSPTARASTWPRSPMRPEKCRTGRGCRARAMTRAGRNRMTATLEDTKNGDGAECRCRQRRSTSSTATTAISGPNSCSGPATAEERSATSIRLVRQDQAGGTKGGTRGPRLRRFRFHDLRQQFRRPLPAVANKEVSTISKRSWATSPSKRRTIPRHSQPEGRQWANARGLAQNRHKNSGLQMKRLDKMAENCHKQEMRKVGARGLANRWFQTTHPRLRNGIKGQRYIGAIPKVQRASEGLVPAQDRRVAARFIARPRN